MKFLVDSNILSEATKPEPNQGVVKWLQANYKNLVFSPIVAGELEYGILKLEDGKKKSELNAWFRGGLKHLKKLNFDFATAGHWANLLSELRAAGHAMPIKDSLIAASALQHGLTIVTRNVKDFQYCGAPTLNPFETDL